MLKIRQLTPQDAKVFKEFRLMALQDSPEAFGSTYESYKKVKLLQVKKGLKNTVALAAFQDNKMVGTAGLSLFYFAKAAHKADINMTFVSKEVRGQGVGKKLMEAVFKKARQLKLEQLNLAVVADNKVAIRLYQSAGFVKFGIEKRALKDGKKYFDECHMAKFL